MAAPSRIVQTKAVRVRTSIPTVDRLGGSANYLHVLLRHRPRSISLLSQPGARAPAGPPTQLGMRCSGTAKRSNSDRGFAPNPLEQGRSLRKRHNGMAVLELPSPGWYEDPQGTGLRWWDGSQWAEFPPSGWYQDPQGKGWRWWDGSQWTEHWEGQARATKTPPSQAAASRDRLGLALVGMLALIGVSLIVIAALKF